jgi:hypothetical protein
MSGPWRRREPFRPPTSRPKKQTVGAYFDWPAGRKQNCHTVLTIRGRARSPFSGDSRQLAPLQKLDPHWAWEEVHAVALLGPAKLGQQPCSTWICAGRVPTAAARERLWRSCANQREQQQRQQPARQQRRCSFRGAGWLCSKQPEQQQGVGRK